MNVRDEQTHSATSHLQGETLHIAGRLQRDGVPALWAALPSTVVAQIDLSAVTALDTAGLALLVELSALSQRANNAAPTILHAPDGYDALCAAYRIRPQLDELPFDEIRFDDASHAHTA